MRVPAGTRPIIRGAIVAWIVQNSSSDGTTLPSGRGALRLTSRGGHRLVHEVPQPRHDLVEVRPRRLLGEHLGGVVHRHHLDRKSTRLNSSHVKTSYAVFCLK